MDCIRGDGSGEFTRFGMLRKELKNLATWWESSSTYTHQQQRLLDKKIRQQIVEWGKTHTQQDSI